ncbi:uncharacterized protein LOC106658073 [Trichogramma pretiosum]|uniref:uncharacterized protein LOC106658073 n=1 Tax=Trichogramma pretiosum TaxID=7493 RepID=UPI0006C9BAEE|nr:uncharacterized protein LOC106658073 [Trichogramma pretiosum]
MSYVETTSSAQKTVEFIESKQASKLLMHKRPKSHVNNSSELKKKLELIQVPPDFILMSLDVTSLFTNIPLRLVLDSLDKRYNDLTRSRQIDGTSMGSPISPLVSDIVIGDLEETCLEELSKEGCNPMFFFRYVDDFVLCIHRNHVDWVVKQFTSYDPSLQLTFELEENRRINFPHLTLIVREYFIITDWYQKPINILTQDTLPNKRSLYIFKRPWKIKTNNENKKSPPKVDETGPSEEARTWTQQQQPKRATKQSPEDEFSAVSYTAGPSYHYCILSVSDTLLTSYVVASAVDGLVDPGRTRNEPAAKRTDVTDEVRQEHKNTEKCKSVFAVYMEEHEKDDHQMHWENVKILDYENNLHRRKVAEMVYTNTNKNTINKQEDTELLNDIYFNILNML